jgi:serine/threonine protein kinase
VAALREQVAASCGPVASAEPSSATQGHPVMGTYVMLTGTEDVMGEGTSSICRRGFIKESGEEVAIKVYKVKQDKTIQRKFERQIRVLEELQEPFRVTDDPSLWNEELRGSNPSRLFMRLLDYSKDSKGHPGPDPTDGVMYVVTELGQYSLKDFLSHRRDQSEPLPVDLVRRVSQAIIHVVAGLHAKSFVHLDLKPENLMMFNGRLKLIDVDGCMRRGDRVAITDESISFSPVYCAPEWANFLIEEDEEDLPEDEEPTIEVVPGLDVWSVGMTICELVTLEPVLKPMYAKFMRSGTSRDEASFMFMDWLSSLKKAPLTKTILTFDKDFVDLLANHLLVCDKEKRWTCAQTLGHQFIALQGEDEDEDSEVDGGQVQREPTGESTLARRKERKRCDIPDDSEVSRRSNRKRTEDLSDNVPVHQGTLWRLNTGADPKDPTQWIKRDMWVSSKGSLCFYSVKDSKRLVLIDSPHLMEASFERFQGGHHPIAFEVRTNLESDEEAHTVFQFACDSEDELQDWMRILKSVSRMENLSTLRLGTGLKAGLKVFKLKVKNRRRPVDGDAAAQYKPVFKAPLWKVKAEGDRMKDEDWFLREMWIAQNGSLVYWSKKEERELVYYTSEDISGASFLKVPDTESSKPFTFQVQLPPADGVEFTPGEFAATSQEDQEKWLSELAKITA